MISVSCLIPAAGLGERFQKSAAKNLPAKLDLLLGGQKLLEKTLGPFLASPKVKEIVLAVPPREIAKFQKRFQGIQTKPIRIVAGGNSRTESVGHALKAARKNIPWIIVHDGARPFLSLEDLEAFLKQLEREKAVIVARPVYPTLKKAIGLRIESTVPRENLWEAETPQGFERRILEKAYAHYAKNPFRATDEASLVEKIGIPIFLFKKKGINLKITDFADYKMGRKIAGESVVTKTGIGFDIHRLVKERPLVLGGVRIPSSKGSLGHSDGDAVLHALSDALLGALALGDIGEYFSDRSKQNTGISSSKILLKVYDLVKKRGYELSSADMNVILEKPRLGPLKEKMKKQIAKLMNVSIDKISIKARTAEGLGAVGRGEAVQAQAIVTVVKHD